MSLKSTYFRAFRSELVVHVGALIALLRGVTLPFLASISAVFESQLARWLRVGVGNITYTIGLFSFWAAKREFLVVVGFARTRHAYAAVIAWLALSLRVAASVHPQGPESVAHG